jgi:hypothetical protein
LMIQGEAGLRAEPVAVKAEKSRLQRKFISGLERSDKITVTFGHRRTDCSLLRH